MSLPQALPLSLHPVTCAESDQGEKQRGPGHGGHGQGVLPSVAPQLSRASPHRSFPSSYPERGRAIHSNDSYPLVPGPWVRPLCLRVASGSPGAGQCVALGWEVTAGSREQRPPGRARVPAPIPLTTLGTAPERPLVPWPRHTSCDLVTRALREAPDLLCALSPSCLQARSPFCVPCDLRAVCGLPSDPQGQSVHSALGSSGVRTEEASGTHIPLIQAQVRTVTIPWKQPPDRAGRGCFLLP